MDTQIKHRIIDKILVNKNAKVLAEIERILDTQMPEFSALTLTDEQTWMLEMSEEDIHQNRVISQEKLNAKDQTWLQEK